MIAYAMLYTVAVGMPVLLATIVLASVVRRYGQPERGIWLTGLTLALAVPIVGLLRIGGGTPEAGPIPAPDVTGVIGLPDVVLMPQAPAGPGLGQIVLASWLLASALLTLRWMVASIRLASAGRSWQRTTLDGVPVWITDKLGPAVAGVVRPRVLVPQWLMSMPVQRRSLVLLHEQEHIRAGDPWLVVLSRVVLILTPWNPVVWILSARLRRAIELDCDRRVLRQRPDVRAYGTTLIEVSSRDHGRLVALAAFAESEAPLRNRILTMTTPSRTVSVVALLTSMVFGVVLMVAAFEIPIPTIRAEFEVGPAAVDGVTPEPGPSGAGAVDAPEPETRVEAEPTPPRIEEPPSVEDALERLRAERQRPESSEPVRGAEPVRVEEAVPSAPTRAPVFTPFTVAPQLLNLAQVQQALTREYPTVLRDSGIGGRVEIWFFIDENGDVAATQINQSSGFEALDQAAMNVASVYRFSPALNRDRRVPVWVSLPITFQVR